ncbi:hypothetical protein GWK16_22585 [Roseomonas sp. JC162]|uniref:Uncharacterized protein n=1 Tax=Neoroseomonas marina TaxID=1232220 RepID=A0A848EKZ8_9PROT|nr:hypothetical protein [Neoroseomonas marina]NMJ44053.1 hypothetical protein [Neoroseomonas marina]
MRFALAVAALVAPVAAQADDDVHCASSRIAAVGRSPDQRRIARGSGVCRMGPKLGFLSDAQFSAQRDVGGAGWTCLCR